MTALMARRGPDDEGFWSDGKRCALGFRRLSILDLKPSGHQPMLSADGRYVLVFNGEVYVYRELRAELQAKGYRFRSTGDAEVVLHALAEWGTEALARFNGMFALAFHDTLAGTLLLARDHAGIKPLYYLSHPHGLVFASQYDQILAHPWSRDARTDERGLALYLRLGYIPAPYGILERTRALEAGSWMQAGPGGIRQGRFFEFPLETEPDLRGTRAAEALDAAIDRSVARHLASDVPVGAFLSGGIDSPLVAAAMRGAHPGAIPAFTIGVTDETMDESSDAAMYARELDLSHQVEIADPQRIHALLPEAVEACGEPFADESIFPTLLVSRLARSEVKVVLSGDGGDELFWGYAGRFGSVLRQAHHFAGSRWKRSLRYFVGRACGSGSVGYNVRRPSIGAWYRAKHSVMAEADLEAIFPDLPAWPEEYRSFEYRGAGLDETAAWMRWNEFTTHLSMVLLKVDRASMYHSLEVRVPLLDREVLSVAARLDWRECLDPAKNVGKLPLRRSLVRRCGRQTAAKRGFSVPLGRWFRGPLQGIVEDCVLARREIGGLPFDARGLRRYFERHLRGESDFGSGIWMLLSLALWQEKHCNWLHRAARETEACAVRAG